MKHAWKKIKKLSKSLKTGSKVINSIYRNQNKYKKAIGLFAKK